MTPRRFCARRILAEQHARRGNILIQVAALIGIMDVQSVAHHAHGDAASPEGAPAGRCVDALCQAADHHGTAAGQAVAQLFRAGNAVGCAVPGAYHGHRRLLVEGGQAALHIQQAGRIIDVLEPAGIFRVLDGQDPQTQPLAVRQNFVSLVQLVVFQGMHLVPGNALCQQEFPCVGVKYVLWAAEMAQQRQPGLIGHAPALRQPYPVF